MAFEEKTNIDKTVSTTTKKRRRMTKSSVKDRVSCLFDVYIHYLILGILMISIFFAFFFEDLSDQNFMMMMMMIMVYNNFQFITLFS